MEDETKRDEVETKPVVRLVITDTYVGLEDLNKLNEYENETLLPITKLKDDENVETESRGKKL